ncbi:BAG family molecular chaperone regulator 4-like [Nicotiana tabacum]|uniref:BAG family molecular chaperone regulator 4-like n=2 Tax=Nicotiana TaxID=4085 RepID=A0A1S3ZGN3_TOBAC|nr:PREDICTED: BAG family molecular chaperone regulator 4-like [Nicotiana sylvestris]XP_016463437.1 PREDICTED: BAG family molecular chaperone regulator 4-like [Nicotiana tabacum]
MEKEGTSDTDNRSTITVNVKFSGRSIPVEITYESTVEHLKSLLQPHTNVLPRGQKLIFKGKVLVDGMTLKSSGVLNGAKIMLMGSQVLHQEDMPNVLEDPAGKERKNIQNTSVSYEAIAGVRVEVDKLSHRVSAIEEAMQRGTKVEDREFVVLTELFMIQLLKLDSIEADGEARAERRKEVHRIQSFVGMLDNCKARNFKL